MLFSIPVWRYPISGMALITVSPSSSTASRNTPCVDGCCGAMLTVMLLSRASERTCSWKDRVGEYSTTFDILSSVSSQQASVTSQREVLAERVAFEIIGSQD